MSGEKIPPNASDCDDQQKHVLANLERRAAAGQIERRGFLQLASAIGIGSAFAAAMADRAMASPQVQGQGGRNIEASYDYIVVGAGSAGCVIAARLSEDPACRVLLIEAGGADISRPSLQSPALWPANFGTDADWAYRTVPQAQAAGRVIDWPSADILKRAKTLAQSASSTPRLVAD